MIAACVNEIERRAAKLDRTFAVYHLIGNDEVWGLQLGKPLFGAAMRDDGRALILEHFAAGSVVVVMMAIDQILDRSLGDFPDFLQIRFCRLRTAIADRVGDDYAGGRDDEHRLMVLIAEDIDVVGAVDLGGRKHWLLCRGLRHGSGCKTGGENSDRKRYEISDLHGWYLPDPKPREASIIPAPKSRTWAVSRVNCKSSTRTGTRAHYCWFLPMVSASSIKRWRAGLTR